VHCARSGRRMMLCEGEQACIQSRGHWTSALAIATMRAPKSAHVMSSDPPNSALVKEMLRWIRSRSSRVRYAPSAWCCT
jgi:hypothetical protein